MTHKFLATLFERMELCYNHMSRDQRLGKSLELLGVGMRLNWAGVGSERKLFLRVDNIRFERTFESAFEGDVAQSQCVKKLLHVLRASRAPLHVV